MSTNRQHLPAPSGSGVLRIKQIDRLFGQANPLFYLTTVVVVASLILGGGTRGGFLSDPILQLIAIPLLLFSLWKLFEAPWTRPIRVALLFCFAIAALPLIQLIPLPPWLWTALPNRQPSAAAFQIVGHAIPWMPISVSPEATWLSALSLVAPLAIFLGTLQLPYRERRLLSLVVLAVGIVSVFVGLIQVAQGQESPLRFFRITNPTEAVGFFANRNHFAALIYVLILFAVAWTVHASTPLGTRPKRSQYDMAPILGAIGGFTVLVVFLAGEAMARSRAGLGLTMVALFGALVLGFSTQSFRPGFASSGGLSRFAPGRLLSGFTPTKLLIAAIVLAATFSLQFALYRVQERFVDPAQDARRIFVPNTIEAARAYMPLGSGLGTFVSVYPLFEKPEDTLIDTYANHAHNDAVEAWLESGVLGLVLMGLFVTWLLLRSVAIWRSPPPPGASELDWSLTRASTIVIGLVLAHSFVDYPLRTGAMTAIMAFACALLIEPPTGAEAREEPGLQVAAKRTRHGGRRRTEPVPSSARSPTARDHKSAKSDAPKRSQDGRWGADINWPEEWSTSSKPGSPGEGEEPPSTSKKSDT
jgi:O-antigen ligase